MDTQGVQQAALRRELAMIKVVAPDGGPARLLDCGDPGAWRRRLSSDDFPLAYAYASARTLRFADGPDEVHRNAIAKLELARYSAA